MNHLPSNKPIKADTSSAGLRPPCGGAAYRYGVRQIDSVKALRVRGLTNRLAERDAIRYALLVTVRAKVTGGRLIVDQPTSLPDGTELELVVDDGGLDLGDAEREALNRAIAIGIAEAEAGGVVEAEEVLAKVRALRS